MNAPYYTQPWFQYLTPTLRSLVEDSDHLFTEVEKLAHTGITFYDHGFVVFSMAKAYEGFLKQFLFDLHLIDQDLFESRRFRIGRAINPDVRSDHRDEKWLFDDLTSTCGSETAHQIWETWLTCRNRVFHFFPSKFEPLSLATALSYLDLIKDTMDKVVTSQPSGKLKLADQVTDKK